MFESIDRHGKCGLCRFLGLLETVAKFVGRLG